MEVAGHEREELESALGHVFADGELLQRALTHSSFRNENTPEHTAASDNETLELLGDAVLGLVATQELVRRFPGWTVGRLSQAKARVVSARSLHSAALRMDLGRYLRLGHGEMKTGLREQRDVLADAYEAVVAAIYLDGGLPAAEKFVAHTLLEPAFFADAGTLGEPDQKSALMEWCQSRGWPLPDYRVVQETGPDHRKRFVVEVSVRGRMLAGAEGSSKKEAEQTAAHAALGQLRAEEPSPL
jgi:ribonuclease-3